MNCRHVKYQISSKINSKTADSAVDNSKQEIIKKYNEICDIKLNIPENDPNICVEINLLDINNPIYGKYYPGHRYIVFDTEFHKNWIKIINGRQDKKYIESYYVRGYYYRYIDNNSL